MSKKRTFYLASSSPRRHKLLRDIGIRCFTLTTNYKENLNQDLDAVTLALELAEGKLRSALELHKKLHTSAWILTADTLLTVNGKKIGKPSNPGDAKEILSLLQGRSHEVITAYCLYTPITKEYYRDWDRTEVVFAPMKEEEIEDYLQTGEWQGVAGGYRIQKRGAIYINKINGSYQNVMGLPVHKVYRTLYGLNFFSQ